MANKETKLSIVIDAQNRAKAGLTDAHKGLEKMKQSAEKLSGTLQTVGKYGAVAFATLSAAASKLIKDSAESLQIEESYRRMTAQIGISSDELIRQLKRTSAGTVSATDLMLSANRAMALGVATDMETVTKLMEIARIKGRALGLDTTQAFNDIVTGIGRGSPLILDNLGIVLKLGEAQDRYAEKLGKTSQELTAAEQKQALLNAVLESGNAELAAAGEIQVTTAESLQAMRAQLSDTADEIGRALIPAATELLKAVTPVLEKFGVWIRENPKLTATIFIAGLALSAMALALGAIGLILPGVITLFTLMAGPVGVIVGIVAALGFTIYQLIGILDILKNDWDSVWLGMKLTVAEMVNSVIASIEGMINFLIRGLNDLISRINSVLAKISEYTKTRKFSIGTLDTVSLGRIDTDKVIQADLAARPEPSVVISGNTFLSEDAAEQMGDLIMSRLKLNTAI